MQDDAFLFIRLTFAGIFAFTLLGGAYMAVNFQKFFGADPNVPSENESARAYSRVQIFMVWAHAVVLSGAFALLFH